MTAAPHWWIEQPFIRPPMLPAPIDRSGFCPKALDPLCDCERDAVSGDEAIAASVSSLLKPSGPTAVSRFVIHVVLDPIERHAVRRITHIGVEICEALPPLAHLDPAPAISREISAIRLLASAQHEPPNHVCAGSGAPVLELVPLGNTATRDGLASHEAIAADDLRHTTIAPAMPERLTAFDAIKRNHFDPPEPLPGSIFQFLHDGYSNQLASRWGFTASRAWSPDIPPFVDALREGGGV